MRRLIRVLRRNQIILPKEIRLIRQLHRTKLKQEGVVSREDIMDVLVEVTPDVVNNVPRYTSWGAIKMKLTGEWRRLIKGSDETDFSEVGSIGYWNIESSPEEILNRYEAVLTAFYRYGLLTEMEKNKVENQLYGYQILFCSSFFEQCQLAVDKQN